MLRFDSSNYSKSSEETDNVSRPDFYRVISRLPKDEQIRLLKRRLEAATNDIPRCCGFCIYADDKGIPVNPLCDSCIDNMNWKWRGPKEGKNI